MSEVFTSASTYLGVNAVTAQHSAPSRSRGT